MPETDPFESFKTMTTTDLHPLPAAEVRRRGDRLRRRNTALAVAGGAVAAGTAIGVPVALSQSGPDAESDPGLYATDGPSTDAVAWRTDIPQDFPMLENLPEENAYGGLVEARDTYEVQSPGPCRGPAWDVAGSLDVLQAVFGDTEGGIDRSLAVFADDTEAATRLDAFAEQAETCRGGGSTVVPLTSDLGEQSAVFANVYDDGTATLYQLVRVGNAVLHTTTTFNGGGDPAVLEQTRELEQDRSAPVVSAMCAFAADPC